MRRGLETVETLGQMSNALPKSCIAHLHPGQEVFQSVSVIYTVRCNAVPGRLNDLDKWLRENGIPFFSQQEGVRQVEVLGDVLLGDPERTARIEVDNLETLQRVLQSEGGRRIRNEFLSLATDVESQILSVQMTSQRRTRRK